MRGFLGSFLHRPRERNGDYLNSDTKDGLAWLNGLMPRPKGQKPTRMVEDNLDEESYLSQCNVLDHARRMYDDTGNAFWAFVAIGASDKLKKAPPSWALELLICAATRAAYSRELLGLDLSMDDALGLKAKRGGTPAAKAAEKYAIEAAAFNAIKVLLACFEVTIPDACEIVHSKFASKLAYGLDHLIDRYYRDGTHRAVAKEGNLNEVESLYYGGCCLLLSERLNARVLGKSPISRLKMRPEFVAHANEIDVHICGISEQ